MPSHAPSSCYLTVHPAFIAALKRTQPCPSSALRCRAAPRHCLAHCSPAPPCTLHAPSRVRTDIHSCQSARHAPSCHTIICNTHPHHPRLAAASAQAHVAPVASPCMPLVSTRAQSAMQPPYPPGSCCAPSECPPQQCCARRSARMRACEPRAACAVLPGAVRLRRLFCTLGALEPLFSSSA
jgi:hypothetical protein